MKICDLAAKRSFAKQPWAGSDYRMTLRQFSTTLLKRQAVESAGKSLKPPFCNLIFQNGIKHFDQASHECTGAPKVDPTNASPNVLYSPRLNWVRSFAREDSEFARRTRVRTSYKSEGRSEVSTSAPAESNESVNDDANAEDKTKVKAVAENVYIALGSNLGNRFEAIEAACKLIDADENMQILETSRLYETDPMYVRDQDSFLNGVCRIRTSLAPLALLDRLQAIERHLGRVKLIDKGPRNIDLDVLLYNDVVMTTERLTIPHAGMLEREFVLKPLCDTQAATSQHPLTSVSFRDHLKQLQRKSASSICALTPLSDTTPAIRSERPIHVTRIMGILNLTPDSFSDGGVHLPKDLETLKDTVKRLISHGADILDVGGQSSRPGAEDVSAAEEISRILPAIEAIKSLPESSGIAISVDTYRAAVAEAAINAGAHIVNDISAGTLDSEMLPTVARLGCTYIMMHMRGTPQTMQSLENTQYSDHIWSSVLDELSQRTSAAQSAGIRRWRIILDPGIGFAKTTEQNYELLESMRLSSEMRHFVGRYPWLVGTSRKRFLLDALHDAAQNGLVGHHDEHGRVWGTQPQDRTFATAATVATAVSAGASIVRVHDVKEMVQVVRASEAIYRGMWRGELRDSTRKS